MSLPPFLFVALTKMKRERMFLITSRYRKHFQGLSPHKRACNFRVAGQNQKPLYQLSIPPPSARIDFSSRLKGPLYCFLSMTLHPMRSSIPIPSHNSACNFRVPTQKRKARVGLYKLFDCVFVR